MPSLFIAKKLIRAELSARFFVQMTGRFNTTNFFEEIVMEVLTD